VYVEIKQDHLQTTVNEEAESLKHEEDKGEEPSTGKPRSSLLIFLRDSRIYIRVLAIMVMIVSFSLILTAVVMWSKAQKSPSINDESLYQHHGSELIMFIEQGKITYHYHTDQILTQSLVQKD